MPKNYEISPIHRLQIVSKIKILTKYAIMPAQILKIKLPFGYFELQNDLQIL